MKMDQTHMNRANPFPPLNPCSDFFCSDGPPPAILNLKKKGRKLAGKRGAGKKSDGEKHASLVVRAAKWRPPAAARGSSFLLASLFPVSLSRIENC